MNTEIKKLAEKAGFVFWEDEDHGPGPGHIDWSNDYDEEFDRFADLLISKCASLASSKSFGVFGAEPFIRSHFGLPNQTQNCVLLSPIKENK